jgi:hypothetical protein
MSASTDLPNNIDEEPWSPLNSFLASSNICFSFFASKFCVFSVAFLTPDSSVVFPWVTLSSHVTEPP